MVSSSRTPKDFRTFGLFWSGLRPSSRLRLHIPAALERARIAASCSGGSAIAVGGHLVVPVAERHRLIHTGAPQLATWSQAPRTTGRARPFVTFVLLRRRGLLLITIASRKGGPGV